uniref:Uncharacterized protein n=1 Tax=Oryza barthii TaxID=65489 RepID=A0A0D3F2B9_9ORYZ
MGAARRLRFGLRAPAASAMSVLLLLLPSTLSLALSPPPAAVALSLVDVECIVGQAPGHSKPI